MGRKEDGVTDTAGARPVRAPRGTELSCRGWGQEAALRMLMNNLDPEVAENPDALVVYGGTGRAARSWDAFDAIVRELRRLADDGIERRPIAGRPAGAAVDDELVGVLGDLRVEVVHEHPEGRFLRPAAAGQLGPARGSDGAGAV